MTSQYSILISLTKLLSNIFRFKFFFTLNKQYTLSNITILRFCNNYRYSIFKLNITDFNISLTSNKQWEE